MRKVKQRYLSEGELVVRNDGLVGGGGDGGRLG